MAGEVETSFPAVGVAHRKGDLSFGFWRVGVRRYSPPWFVAVHAPVPLVIGLRLMLGVGSRRNR